MITLRTSVFGASRAEGNEALSPRLQLLGTGWLHLGDCNQRYAEGCLTFFRAYVGYGQGI